MVNMNCNFREVQSDYNQGIKELTGLEITSSLSLLTIIEAASEVQGVFQRKHSSYFSKCSSSSERLSLPKISPIVHTDVRSDDEAKILILSKACGSRSLISVQNKEYISKDISSKTLNHLLFSFVQSNIEKTSRV